MADKVAMHLDRDVALVIFEWLARGSDIGHVAPIEDQAEQRALWDLEATLEAHLDVVVSGDYQRELVAARRRVRDGPS